LREEQGEKNGCKRTILFAQIYSSLRAIRANEVGERGEIYSKFPLFIIITF
jgi:hypothetical protein